MTGNRDNTTRTKARRRAVELLYEADVRELDPRDILAERVDAAEPVVRPFTAELVTGVADHADEVDGVLRSSLSAGWTLERMPRVDRALARIATYELMHTDTGMAIVANEAGDLAAEMSTDQSPGFITGLLDRVARTLKASDDEATEGT